MQLNQLFRLMPRFTYTELLQSDGFSPGVSNGAVFYKESTDVRVMVHGDDLAVCGRQEDIDKFESLLAVSVNCR